VYGDEGGAGGGGREREEDEDDKEELHFIRNLLACLLYTHIYFYCNCSEVLNTFT
jgi:hypothetical protein